MTQWTVNVYFDCFCSYEELEQMQNYSGAVKYEPYKHQPAGEVIVINTLATVCLFHFTSHPCTPCLLC